MSTWSVYSHTLCPTLKGVGNPWLNSTNDSDFAIRKKCLPKKDRARCPATSILSTKVYSLCTTAPVSNRVLEAVTLGRFHAPSLDIPLVACRSIETSTIGRALANPRVVSRRLSKTPPTRSSNLLLLWSVHLSRSASREFSKTQALRYDHLPPRSHLPSHPPLLRAGTPNREELFTYVPSQAFLSVPFTQSRRRLETLPPTYLQFLPLNPPR